MLPILLPFALLSATATDPAEARIRKDVTHLASPALRGRGNGDEGLDKASAYVVARYKAIVLRPKVQRFPFIGKVSRTAQGAALAGQALAWGKDIEAVGYSADADLKGLDLHFAGCGLKAGGYDDLGGVKGKAVVILRKVPEAQVLAHLPRLEKSLMMRVQKLEAAGAAAVIVAEDDAAARPLIKEEGPTKVGLPVVSMPAARLAALGDLGQLAAKIAETGAAQSVPDLPRAFDLKLALARKEAQLPNIAVLVPGRDPRLKDEVIVVGAHMDHLGMGERHSMAGAAGLGQVHPGADDNASGTAMVLELGRRLKAKPLQRPVLLLHFAGEEEGLLGSAHWVQHPTLPLPSVKFMINLDMVGRVDKDKPAVFLGGLGAPKASVEQAVKLAPAGWKVGAETGALTGGSDHMSFSSAKIPTFFYFTGLHGDYHRPSDTAEKINIPAMATLSGMVYSVAAGLDAAPQLPAFDPETAKLPAAKKDGGPMRVAFGTIPDYTENPAGFRITGTSSGGTAEAIGMKAGDIIVRFGDTPVKTIYDYMGALGAYKPGDKVIIRWLRDGQEMQAEALLKGR